MDLEKRNKLREFYQENNDKVTLCEQGKEIVLNDTLIESQVDWDSGKEYVISPYCQYVKDKVLETGGKRLLNIYEHWLNNGKVELHFSDPYECDDCWVPFNVPDKNIFDYFLENSERFDLRINGGKEVMNLQEENNKLLHEVAKLKERLEVDDEHGYDGIACRDETIKLQDKYLDELKEQNKLLKQGFSMCLQLLINSDQNNAYSQSIKFFEEILEKVNGKV